ncbi:MFS transporter [Pseudaestuariivita rosea]|uniref:MFS transporter n=1 Tax=Pseudaestuariivita rosea TaxID=2763263 RepID=UPI001F01BC02|nr:MFS transporter [Pseudaestuariivita rosea]
MHSKAKSILFLTVFIDLLGYGIIIPLLPEFARNIGATAMLVGIIVASYSAMQFLFSPILGSLSDKFGRRPILLATIALNGGAYLLFGFVESLALLVASRVIAGIGAANLAVAQAYLSDITPPKDRVKAFGMIGAALGMGFVFGPPLGGFITDQFGTAAVGFFVASLCWLNFVLAAIRLPETIGAKQAQGTEQPAHLNGFEVVKASGTLKRLFAVYFVFIVGFAILTVVSALLWVDRFGLTPAQVGYAFGLIGVVMAVVQGLIGKISAKVSQASLLKAGLSLMAVTMCAMPFVPADMFVPAELLMIGFFSVGYGLALPVGTALVAIETPDAAQGKVLGLYQALGALGRIIGPLIGGATYGLGMAVPFVVGAAFLGLALIIALAIPSSTTRARAHAAT